MGPLANRFRAFFVPLALSRSDPPFSPVLLVRLSLLHQA